MIYYRTLCSCSCSCAAQNCVLRTFTYKYKSDCLVVFSFRFSCVPVSGSGPVVLRAASAACIFRVVVSMFMRASVRVESGRFACSFSCSHFSCFRFDVHACQCQGRVRSICSEGTWLTVPASTFQSASARASAPSSWP